MRNTCDTFSLVFIILDSKTSHKLISSFPNISGEIKLTYFLTSLSYYIQRNSISFDKMQQKF